jgi:diguanylate cyclase (GGDEF)-like protein/PAS domain S-box-containing protein
MNTLTPIVRISMSLALLALGIFLSGDLFFGVRSDEDQIRMEARLRICEALAIQFSSLIAVNDMSTIKLSLNNLVKRDDDIVSAALRTADGKIQAEAGNHNAQWQNISFDKSTLTHTQVPIFRDIVRWGTVEIRFAEAEEKAYWQKMFSPYVLLATYIFIAGFVGYIFFMRRTLRHLDPSAVIPDRVKTAMDALTEGVILVDGRQQVVLANSAISDKLGVDSAALLGENLSSLGWSLSETAGSPPTKYPWQAAMADGESHTGTRLCLIRGGVERIFMVNSSPILDDNGKPQGALATFNDVTELENKNEQLSELVEKLRSSQTEVSRKNEELQVLAERDPLTNCLNRRAFFEKAELEFEACVRSGEQISAIMLDIDFFKTINDTHGHTVGDEVIKSVVSVLQKGLPNGESVGRYGGEEFCVLLPGTDITLAAMMADRLRKQIAKAVENSVRQLTSPLTASFGVASIACGGKNASNLIDQADVALYASKETGRNKVTRWDEF